MNSKFIMSYWDMDDVKNIFSQYRIEEIDVIYASKNTHQRELLIMNFD